MYFMLQYVYLGNLFFLRVLLAMCAPFVPCHDIDTNTLLGVKSAVCFFTNVTFWCFFIDRIDHTAN